MPPKPKPSPERAYVRRAFASWHHGDAYHDRLERIKRVSNAIQEAVFAKTPTIKLWHDSKAERDVPKEIVIDEGIRTLTKHLRPTRTGVCDQAGFELSRVPDERAARAICALFHKRSDRPFAHTHIDIVRNVTMLHHGKPTEELVPIFGHATESKDMAVRMHALGALIKLRSPAALHVLEESAARGDFNVDMTFLSALNQQRTLDPENLPVVVQYANAQKHETTTPMVVSKIHTWLSQFARKPQTASHAHVKALRAMDAHLRVTPQPLGEFDALLEHPTVAARAYHAALYPPQRKPFRTAAQRELFIQQLRDQVHKGRVK